MNIHAIEHSHRTERVSSERSVPRIRLRGIVKSFPGVRALNNVSIDVNAGEVHAILGQNGAGKSSLIKVLCGAYRADAGTIEIDGHSQSIRSPSDAKRLGISVIFQEFSLVPHLDIAQNIFLGREKRFVRFGIIDRAAMYSAVEPILDRLGLDEDIRRHAADLDVAQQQMVEIAKALSQDARVLVMDEPTAALSEREAERLFEVIARLRASGVAIIYISHRMKEVIALSDRITVLRDGCHVVTLSRGEARPAELVRLMVGRPIDAPSRRTPRAGRGGILEVEGLCTHKLHAVSLRVAEGEVVGLAGLVGAGRTELARAVFGADPVRAGQVFVRGKILKLNPVDAARAGIALVPEDRKRQGLALQKSVRDNSVASSMWRLSNAGFLGARVINRQSDSVVDRLGVKSSSTAQVVRHLSGGNQQKIVIGKWLAAGACLFILDEPTRGIDVGAKFEIYRLIDDLVAEGAGVLLISSELPELIHLSDRAYVMRDGRIVGHLSGSELSEEAIINLAVHDD